ncbi:MAG: glycosyltransferase family 87 protein [Planctomycetia bacterium]|nr:glycosyltransferase family 87 protein [Planctomycetia bacterium]
MDAHEPTPQSWYLTPRFRQVATAALIVFAAVEACVAVGFKYNDIGGHITYGGLLLKQGPAAVNWFWYPFGRMSWNAVLAIFGQHGGKALCFSLSMVAVVATFRMWHQLAERRMRGTIELSFAAAVFAVLASCTLIQRDLDECGLHLQLLFFLTAAVFALTQGRQRLCGFWTAVAITFKTTPLLFVPFLLWKRKWRAAGWSVAFTLLFNFAPAVFFGWNETLAYHVRWLDAAKRSTEIRDPSMNAIEPARHLNQSLTMALSRLVQTYRPGHDLYLDKPGFVQFFDLDVDAARRFVKCSVLVLLLGLAWKARSHSNEDIVNLLPAEWAGVGLMAALLSPLCWKQHLVMCLPALFLTIREQLLIGQQAGWRKWAVGLFAALVLLSSRGLIPYDWAILALTYKTFTIAALIALMLLVMLPPRTSS